MDQSQDSEKQPGIVMLHQDCSDAQNQKPEEGHTACIDDPFAPLLFCTVVLTMTSMQFMACAPKQASNALPSDGRSGLRYARLVKVYPGYEGYYVLLVAQLQLV